MKFNKLLTIIIFVYLSSCAGYEKHTKEKEDSKNYFASSGFALIYDESLYKNKIVNKKMDNNDLNVFHAFLKRNTPIRITNLSNSKTLDLKVSKRANYPKIFNIVLSKRVSTILELDNENPLVEIIELKKNKTFIAKEGNIFDEEKNVADKAPVDEIKMNDITTERSKQDVEKTNNKKFILVISDFYYKESALELKKDLVNKISLDNISIKKINNNKYRLLIGPFKNFNALKTTYISLNNLGFEGLNIYKE